jgi:hypothetical protein
MLDKIVVDKETGGLRTVRWLRSPLPDMLAVAARDH